MATTANRTIPAQQANRVPRDDGPPAKHSAVSMDEEIQALADCQIAVFWTGTRTFASRVVTNWNQCWGHMTIRDRDKEASRQVSDIPSTSCICYSISTSRNKIKLSTTSQSDINSVAAELAIHGRGCGRKTTRISRRPRGAGGGTVQTPLSRHVEAPRNHT